MQHNPPDSMKFKMRMSTNAIPPITPLGDDLRHEIRSAMRSGPALRLSQEHTRTLGTLRPMPVEDVRVGCQGGLPYEYLSTDIYSGCLPIGALCYANCSLGLVTVERGFDFGNRKINRFNESLIQHDIAQLDQDQRWIRQGWNSDVSFSLEGWERTVRLAEMLRESDRHLVLLTKAVRHPGESAMRRLAATGAELRISISAFDEDRALGRRLQLLEAYRDYGGIAVPYLMTMVFRTAHLAKRQVEIFDWIISGDFPGAEQPLRINTDNPLSRHLDPEQLFSHPKFPDQQWSGRLYPKELPLPAPPSLRPSYQGPGHRYRSRVDWTEVSSQFDQGTPTNRQLVDGDANLAHPNLHRHGTPSIGISDATTTSESSTHSRR